jgi:DNA-binding SARP family transcriptional activator/TolB-like protein/Flp pilus assembly protein TadD
MAALTATTEHSIVGLTTWSPAQANEHAASGGGSINKPAVIPTHAAGRLAGPPAPFLRLMLLGQMQATDAAGRSLLPRARKTRAILAVLGLSAPRPVLRLQLTALLWSQRDREQARASLRQAVHELQDIFGNAHGRLLVADRHHLALRAEGLTVDALLATRADSATPERLELFRDVLLDDLAGLDPAFDRWLDDERRRLTRTARAIGESLLAEQSEVAGQLAAAERLLMIDRTHEGAWRTIMRAHAERGDRAAAITTFERCRAALAEAAQVAPSPDTDALIARIRASGPDPLSAASEPGGSLDIHPGKPGGIEGRNGRTGVRLGIPPLRTIGAKSEDELSVGLAEEITAALSRFRWIACVPGTALTVVAGDAPRPEALAWSSLDLDFVLDGTIQRGANRIRVMARLLDVRASGAVVWARRFDRPSADILTLQDEIGAAIVAQVDPELMMREGERVAARRLTDPSAQDLVIQAVPAIYRLERGSFHAAGTLLETALQVDPGNSVAHAWYAYWHLFLVGQGWAADPVSITNRAADLAERAVTLDPGDARALTLAGHVRGFLGKRAEEASALHERALALNPNLALAWCFSGLAHSYLGRHDEAIQRIHQAVLLSPSDPHLFFFDMALIMPHLLLGDFERAVEIGRRAIELNPWFSSSYKGHLSALGHLGRDREASETLGRLLILEPGFCVAAAVERSPIGRQADVGTYADGLRKAGLRETAMG